MKTEFDRPRGLKENIEKARLIEAHLRIPTMPVGLKFYKIGEAVPEGVGERPDFKGTFCQYISFARYERCLVRKNYIVNSGDFNCPFAAGVLGFEPWDGFVATGEHMGGVHFATAEAAGIAQKDIPKITPNTMKDILVGPLQDLTIEPDVILFAVCPGMINKVLDGQMWNTGNPNIITYFNMCGICAVSAAQAYLHNDLFIGLPCHGGRRMGFFTDSEVAVGLNINFFEEWVTGMEKAYVTGHSFPVGYMLAPNPPLPPHNKILEWPDKVVTLDEWVQEHTK